MTPLAAVVQNDLAENSSHVLPPPAAPSRHSPRRVLFAIDQLRQLGGAERMLFETIKRLDPKRFVASIVTFDLDSDLPSLRGLPASVFHLPLRKTYDRRAFKAALELRRLLRDQRIDIFHSFFETSDLWAAPIAKLCGCPVLLSSRRDMGILRGRKHRLAYPLVNRIFQRVLTVSDQVRNATVTKEKLSPAKVEALYNGIDIDEIDALAGGYQARERFSIPQTSPLIAAVANIRRVKGIDVLVRAAALVIRQFPEARFAIAGKILEAEAMTELHALVAELNIKKNLLFLGPLENPYPLLAAGDVFALPSRNEGFSNALIEAMASSLPCVATRVGGNAEALEEGVSGLLIDSEDHHALAERIIGLLRNPDAARRMGRQARSTARHRFSMAAVVERLMDIYDELLESAHVT